MTREEILDGLRAGRTLHIVRRDDPVARLVSDLVNEGQPIECVLVQLDEQSSELRCRWKDPGNADIR